MVKKRENSIDAAAGTMILYMMFVHIGCPQGMERISLILHHLLFYFMAWFFFKAGMFYKERTIKEEWKYCRRRIVIPLICFTVFGQMVEWTRFFTTGDNNWVHYVLSPIKEMIVSGYTNGNSPMYFLFTMLLARLLFTLLVKLPPPIVHKDVVVGISVTMLFLSVSYARDIYGICLPNYIYNVPLAMIFMATGIAMRFLQHEKRIVYVSILLWIMLSMVDFSYVVFISGNLIEGNSYLMFILLSIAGIIVYNCFFRVISKWYGFPVLSYIGRHSMAYFVMHMPLLTLMKMYLPLGNDLLLQIFKIIILGIIITSSYIYLRNKNLSWIFGE